MLQGALLVPTVPLSELRVPLPELRGPLLELRVSLLVEDEVDGVQDVLRGEGRVLEAVLHGQEVPRRVVQADRNTAGPGVYACKAILSQAMYPAYNILKSKMFFLYRNFPVLWRKA